MLGLNLTWSLLLDGCWRWRWRRWLGRGTYWCLGHVRQVEEQVEAFDQCGWYGHGGHAVHSFLTVKEETERRSSPLIQITILLDLYIQSAKQNKASLVFGAGLEN